MLARAVVLQPRQLGPALEVVLRRVGRGENTPHDRELLRRRAMRRADEGDLLVVEIRPRPDDGQCLDRLRGGAEEADEGWVPRGELEAPVTDRYGMDEMAGLDHLAARHLDDDRLHGG